MPARRDSRTDGICVLARSILGLLICALLGCAGNSNEPVGDYSALSRPRAYTVKSGDTMYSIAFRYGMDYRKLAAANAIRPPYTIYPGELLLLDETHQPGMATAPPVAVAHANPVAPVHPAPPAIAPAPVAARSPAPAPASASAATTAPIAKPYPIIQHSTAGYSRGADLPSAGASGVASPTAIISTPAIIPTQASGVEAGPAAGQPVAVETPAESLHVLPIEDEMRSVNPTTVASAAPAAVPPQPSATVPEAKMTPPATPPVTNAPEPKKAVAPESTIATAQQGEPVIAPQPAPAAASRPAAKPQPSAAEFTGETIDVWRWPASGSVTRGYSESVHKGIDIGGTRGDPVVAAAAGKVVYAGTGIVGFGELLIIKHNDIYLSAYGHNDELLVKEGDMVSAGQQIAQKGNSGTDTVKLHFEVRKEGKPIDPQRVLPPR